MQDCSDSSALAMELLQSCSKPSMHYEFFSGSEICRRLCRSAAELESALWSGGCFTNSLVVSGPQVWLYHLFGTIKT